MITADIFFKELVRLNELRHRRPNLILNSPDSDWANSAYFCKNVYWAFDCSKSNDSAYIYDSNMMIKSFDCDYSDEAELCYESTDARKCYNCTYLENCENTRDSEFCARCSNCHDCFGCVNLKNKEYCIFNRQLTPEEYKELLPKFKSWTPDQIFSFINELKKRYPLTQTIEQGNTNASFGNYIYNNKNSYMCFDASNNENCGYIYDSSKQKNCFDFDHCGPCELCYEASDSINLFNCNYIIWSGGCIDCSYMIDSGNCKNVFGGIGIKNKQYVLLNRQLTKEDYERLVPPLQAEIVAKNLGWGPLKY
jgi:hypothetical protein